MAEAFLRHYFGDGSEVHGAGIEPKDIHPLTKKVMGEIGVDISAQHSKALRDYMGRIHFGYLTTVCADAEKNCPTTLPGISQRVRWNLEDPVSSVRMLNTQLDHNCPDNERIDGRRGRFIACHFMLLIRGSQTASRARSRAAHISGVAPPCFDPIGSFASASVARRQCRPLSATRG
jgi:arsenate reductase